VNKQLKFITRTVFVLFLALFVSVTMIQVVSADELRANPLNQRSIKNSFQIERGSILVDGDPIATSSPSDDQYHFTRKYTNGPLYSPVTGYFSHYQGATGIESKMNAELSGVGNAQFFTRVMRIASGADPQGSSVELSLNPKAQRAAVEAMGNMKGAVVALDPKTGRILALASTPSYDPNKLAVNDSSEIIKNYKAYEDDPNHPLANRAIAGNTYHPGSTFKIVSSAAAIESGKVKPSSKFPNPATYKLPQSSSELHNWSREKCGPGDDATLEYAIQQSCNIPIAEMSQKLDKDAISKTAEKFGFGKKVEIPLTATASAAPIPGDKAQQALSSIGQWDVRATPLQMAMVSAGIGNNGTVMQPTLVDKIITPDLRVEDETKPKVFNKAISEKTAHAVRDMMKKSVSDGIASSAAVTGVDVAGKTGTAENGNDENGNPLPYTIWFTGFAPADDPDIAVAVVVEDAGGEAYNYEGSSSDIPTEISKKVMEAVLNE
jgi:peptidoglycan glycosyltransferase